MNLEEVVLGAEERALSFIETGTDAFSPVVELTSDEGYTVVVFMDNPLWNEPEARFAQMRGLGKLAKSREDFGNISFVVLISEAWTKKVKKGEVIEARLKDAPDKIESLVVFGSSEDGETICVTTDIFREEDDTIVLTKDRTLVEGGNSPLLEEFWLGYNED